MIYYIKQNPNTSVNTLKRLFGADQVRAEELKGTITCYVNLRGNCRVRAN